MYGRIFAYFATWLVMLPEASLRCQEQALCKAFLTSQRSPGDEIVKSSEGSSYILRLASLTLIHGTLMQKDSIIVPEEQYANSGIVVF